LGRSRRGIRSCSLLWTNAVSAVLSPTAYHQNWNSVKTNLTPDVMTALEFTADRLDVEEVATEESIPADQLKKILADVEKLQKCIGDSDLHKSVKAILWQQAESIRLAVYAYKIRGASAVKEALERAFGAVLINGEVFKEQQNHAVVRDFLRVAETAYKYMAPVLKLAPAVLALKKLLGGD